MIPLAQSMPPQIHTPPELMYGFDRPSAQINAPWRYAALAELRFLEDTGQNRPGQGDLRVAERTSSHVRQILFQINLAELPTPVVAPISGGGISVWWGVGNREVRLSVFSDGEVIYLRIGNDVIYDDPEESPAETRYAAGLNWLLGREG